MEIGNRSLAGELLEFIDQMGLIEESALEGEGAPRRVFANSCKNAVEAKNPAKELWCEAHRRLELSLQLTFAEASHSSQPVQRQLATGSTHRRDAAVDGVFSNRVTVLRQPLCEEVLKNADSLLVGLGGPDPFLERVRRTPPDRFQRKAKVYHFVHGQSQEWPSAGRLEARADHSHRPTGLQDERACELTGKKGTGLEQRLPAIAHLGEGSTIVDEKFRTSIRHDSVDLRMGEGTKVLHYPEALDVAGEDRRRGVFNISQGTHSLV
jgi:hypothetical protein